MGEGGYDHELIWFEVQPHSPWQAVWGGYLKRFPFEWFPGFVTAISLKFGPQTTLPWLEPRLPLR